MAQFKLLNPKEPHSRRRIFIYLLVLAALLIVFSVALIGTTGTPEFCNLCHSMKPNYKSWKKSTHSNITCLACHAAPGGAFTKIAEDVFVNIPIGIKEFTGYKSPINAESEISQEHMENERCLRCHSPKTRKFTSRLDLKMDGATHQKHLKKDLRCTTCHNRVTHLKMGKRGLKYANFLKMKEGCFRCHSVRPKPQELAKEVRKIALDKKVPTGCTTCHPKGWEKLPPIGHGNDWRLAHGPTARKDFSLCFKCHDKIKVCSDCHHKERIKLAKKICAPHHDDFKKKREDLVVEAAHTPEPTRSTQLKKEVVHLAHFKLKKKLDCLKCHTKVIPELKFASVLEVCNQKGCHSPEKPASFEVAGSKVCLKCHPEK